jgi:hypothetical protein
MKKFDWIVVGLILVLVLSSQVYAALSPADSLMAFFNIDDAYYYFKTAQNISLGYGVTFDRINPGNGFHPLWMFICVPIFAIFNQDLISPLRVITILMGVLNAGTSILLYFLLKKALSPWIAGLGALFWALTPEILNVTSRYGLETGLSIFSIVLFLFLVSRFRENPDPSPRKWIKLIGIGFSAALVVFSRLDNIFIVAAIGMWFVLRELHVSPFYFTNLFLSVLSVIVSFIIRIGLQSDYKHLLPALFTMLWVAALVRSIVFVLMRVNHKLRETTWFRLFLHSVVASTLSTAFIVLIMLTLSYTKIIPSFPRSTLVIDAILSFMFLTGWRIIWKLIRNKPNPGEASNFSMWAKTNWKRFIFEGLAFMGPVVILLAGYLAWNYSGFGTLLPISGQIKHWWGTLPNTVYGHQAPLTTALGLAPNRDYGPLVLLTNPLNNLVKLLQNWFNSSRESTEDILLLSSVIIIGVLYWLLTLLNKDRFRVSLRKTGILPLALGCFIQFSYYQGANYLNTRFWYWIADMLMIVILFVILANIVYDRLIHWRVPLWVINGVIAVFGAGLIFFFVNRVGFNLSYHPNPERHDWYLSDARGLELNTEPGSIIGMTGGGTIGYFIQQRTIINLDGLMNSYSYFQDLQKGNVTAFLVREKMRYIFANKNMITASDPYQTLFKDQLEKILLIRGEEDFTLFRYLPVP